MVRFPSKEPIDENASFEGAKIVTSVRESTVLTRSACVRAPAREVRLRDMAVLEGDVGRVRTLEIMWIVPPVKDIF